MRIPHSAIIIPAGSKRDQETKENDDHSEDGELPLFLQGIPTPATGVSEFERGLAVHDMTKKADDKRKAEIAARKAIAPIVIESNKNVLHDSEKGKKAKPKKKSKRN